MAVMHVFMEQLWYWRNQRRLSVLEVGKEGEI